MGTPAITPTHPCVTLITERMYYAPKKYPYMRTLNGVKYTIGNKSYMMDIDKADLKRFEYEDFEEDDCYRRYKVTLTPDDLTNEQLLELIPDKHHEDCLIEEEGEAGEIEPEPDSGEEQEELEESMPAFSFRFDMRNKTHQDYDLKDVELYSCVWATYDPKQSPKVQVKRLMYKGNDLWGGLLQVFGFGNKNSEALLNDVEILTMEHFEDNYV